MLAASGMRHVRPVALVVLLVAPASADRLGAGSSGGGGGGRLGAVSSGLSHATGGNAVPSGGGDSSARVYDERDYEHCSAREGQPCELDVIVPVGAPPGVLPVAVAQPAATLEAYAGVQAVYESTGSLSLEAAVAQRWFRMEVALSHYVEDRMNASALSMTTWQLAAGVRIDDGGASRAYVIGGATGAKTRGEPDGDSALTGALVGARLDHPVSRRTALFGVAHASYFSHGVRAYGGRVGARYGHFEAALRVLDFNVGPALFGPELGVRF